MHRLPVQAYLVVAPELASFSGYHDPLARSLLDVKLAHWDVSIRRLAAEALGKMVHLKSNFYAHEALPTLLSRAVSPVLEVLLPQHLQDMLTHFHIIIFAVGSMHPGCPSSCAYHTYQVFLSIAIPPRSILTQSIDQSIDRTTRLT
jgi:hypothetical protein